MYVFFMVVFRTWIMGIGSRVKACSPTTKIQQNKICKTKTFKIIIFKIKNKKMIYNVLISLL